MAACSPCDVKEKAAPSNLIVTGPQIGMPPVSAAVLDSSFSQQPMEIQFSKWLQDKLETERSNVVQQLEEHFARYVIQHNQHVMDKVKELSVSNPPSSQIAPSGVQALKEARLSAGSVHEIHKGLGSTNAVNFAVAGSLKSMQAEGSKGAEFGHTHTMAGGSETKSALKAAADVKKSQVHRPHDTDRMRNLAESWISFDGSKNCFTRIVHTSRFEVVAISLIFLNAALMATEIEYKGFETGYIVKYDSGFNAPASERWKGAEDVFDYLNYVFNACFCVELLLRLLAYRTYAFRDKWIWFDTILVSFGVISMFEINPSMVNPSMARLLRLARVARLLKLLKSVKAFDVLFLLMKSIRACGGALLWSFIILLVTMAIAGMALNQLLFEYMNDSSIPKEERREVFRYYGTFSKLTVTMYEITIGNWVPSCRTLMENVSNWYGVFYILYSCTFAFALVNVIRAVFITETNRVASADDEVMMLKKSRDRESYLLKIHDLFAELDDDQDGCISSDEFKALGADNTLRTFLSSLELDFLELETLFTMLDNGDGYVDLDEFEYGVSMLRGPAKAIDMIAMLGVLHKVESMLHHILDPGCAYGSTGSDGAGRRHSRMGSSKEKPPLRLSYPVV